MYALQSNGELKSSACRAAVRPTCGPDASMAEQRDRHAVASLRRGLRSWQVHVHDAAPLRPIPAGTTRSFVAAL